MCEQRKIPINKGFRQKKFLHEMRKNDKNDV